MTTTRRAAGPVSRGTGGAPYTDGLDRWRWVLGPSPGQADDHGCPHGGAPPAKIAAHAERA